MHNGHIGGRYFVGLILWRYDSKKGDLSVLSCAKVRLCDLVKVFSSGLMSSGTELSSLFGFQFAS